MKIIYVHHGKRKKGNPPSQSDDLTELGYQDCELVASLLSNDSIREKVKEIYTSNFFRCRKTAEIINNKLGVSLIEDERLNEKGSVESETWVELQTRVMNSIQEIIAKYDNEDVVICVTSGVNIASFINIAYGLEASENAPYLYVPSCSPIMFDFKN